MSECRVIHDIGYQRYEGPRLGRGYAARSLYGLGVRTAFGIGRGAKAKIFPWIAIGIVLVVAVVVTAIRTQVGRPVMGYLEFPGAMSFLVLLFCAVVAPELVSRDLRSGVLPLYFSRPLTRSDYALAKLGAMVTAVWLLLAGPHAADVRRRCLLDEADRAGVGRVRSTSCPDWGTRPSSP